MQAKIADVSARAKSASKAIVEGYDTIKKRSEEIKSKNLLTVYDGLLRWYNHFFPDKKNKDKKSAKKKKSDDDDDDDDDRYDISSDDEEESDDRLQDYREWLGLLTTRFLEEDAPPESIQSFLRRYQFDSVCELARVLVPAAELDASDPDEDGDANSTSDEELEEKDVVMMMFRGVECTREINTLLGKIFTVVASEMQREEKLEKYTRQLADAVALDLLFSEAAEKIDAEKVMSEAQKKKKRRLDQATGGDEADVFGQAESAKNKDTEEDEK